MLKLKKSPRKARKTLKILYPSCLGQCSSASVFVRGSFFINLPFRFAFFQECAHAFGAFVAERSPEFFGFQCAAFLETH